MRGDRSEGSMERKSGGVVVEFGSVKGIDVFVVG